MLVALSAVAPASAQQIGGATYSGALAEGGSITFTVAPGGGRLTSYRIVGPSGAGCSFVARGDADEWQGTAIDNGGFAYDLDGVFAFAGRFFDAQTAAGTTWLANPAVPGVRPACESGPLRWTATTTATAPAPAGTAAPPPPPDGSAAATDSPPRVGLAGHRKPRFKTTLTLRARGTSKLIGRLDSRRKGCRSGRRVTLERGRAFAAKTTSEGDGTFTFQLKRTLRGRKPSAAVSARSASSLTCAAGRSRSLQAGPTRSQTASSPGVGS